jgi:hypothetical protein
MIRPALFVLLMVATLAAMVAFWLPGRAPREVVIKQDVVLPPPVVLEERSKSIPLEREREKGKGLRLPPLPDESVKRLPPPVLPPPTTYEKAKKEVADWLGIAGKASPFVTFVAGFIVKGKKRGKRR